MYNVDYKDLRREVGVFKKHHNSYYTFELTNGDLIVFECIDINILKEFQLRTDKYIDVLFDIEFSEIYDEFESDEFVVFKLEKLELLSEK